MQENNVVRLLEQVVEQQNEVLRELHAQRQELETQKKKLEDQSKEMAMGTRVRKDRWDRCAAIAPIVSAFIIALIGAYFTYSYNQQQLKVQEIQTIERFMPHLMGNEKSKRAAILAISSLGNAKIAAKVASIYASEGTASALQSIAEKSETKDKQFIRDALAQTLDSLADKYQYENKFDDALETYKRALAIKEEAVGKDSPELAENLDKLARMYQLHGDHAMAAMTLKRSAALRSGNGASADSEPVADTPESTGSNYAHAANITREQPEASKASEAPKPATDLGPGSHGNEPELAPDKHVQRPPANKPDLEQSHANSHMADDMRVEVQ